MLFGWLLDSMSATVQDGVQHLLGARQGDAFRAWSNWYHANQLKFTFWFLYLAAICDDLGIPNLKTLSAKLWPQLRKQKKK